MVRHSQSISTNQGPLYIKRCKCGGVHLCIGGVSINLTNETALYISDQLNEACAQIREESTRVDVEKIFLPRLAD